MKFTCSQKTQLTISNVVSYPTVSPREGNEVLPGKLNKDQTFEPLKTKNNNISF